MPHEVCAVSEFGAGRAPQRPAASTSVETARPSSSRRGPSQQSVRTTAGWILCSAAAAAVAAVIWVLAAPRVSYTVQAQSAQRDLPQPDAFFGADLLLGGLLAAAGVILAVIWLLRGRPAPGSALLGLVVGGVLGGILAAALGATVTSDDLAAVAKTAPDGLVLTAPLKLRSQTMLLWWPALAAALVAASLWLRPPAQQRESPR